MGSIAKGTRHTLYTSVSIHTYQKLKDVKKLGWATGRVIDYLVDNYLEKIEVKLPILNFERGNLPTPAFDESGFGSKTRNLQNAEAL